MSYMNKSKEALFAGQKKNFEVLCALMGIHAVQEELRAQGDAARAHDLRRYYNTLPEDISRRLTELGADEIEKLAGMEPVIHGREGVQPVAEMFANDAAFAQVIRAANIYRARFGLIPLGPDGRLELN